MTPELYLSELQPGQKCRVVKLLSADGIRRRLLDIGLVENTEIECIGRSPMGDPSAFYIRGAVIAIRKKDCQNIMITKKGL